MEMCYDGALVMPSNYVAMNEDEMTYVEGGFSYSYSKNNIRARVNASYLSRTVCIAFGTQVVMEHGKWGFCNGMSVLRIARELFAHAVGYYAASALKKAGVKSDFINDIRKCGQYADIGLGDGLEAAYLIVWSFGGI